MTLEEQFNDAQERVRTLTTRPSNEDLLGLYGLFKQATEGDVHGKKPGMFDLKAAAKYSAWEKRKGTDRDEAMRQYIAKVDALLEAEK